MNTLPQLARISLPANLDLSVLAGILSYPTWNFVQEAIVATRSYEEGLESGLALLSFLEARRDELQEEVYAGYAKRLLFFIINMMDKLDRWEEYLQSWNSIRENSSFFLTYASGARSSYGARFEPFVLGTIGDSLKVHFLCVTLHRKEVLERKVKKARAGGKVGNLYHGKREDLAPDEIERRVEWITRIANESIAQAKADSG